VIFFNLMSLPVSIIILHYKTPEVLDKCLNSILKYYPQEIGHVLVIDNNSGSDFINNFRAKFSQVRLLASKHNVGFAKGVNWGLENADKEYILSINPDIILEPGNLELMLEFMKARPMAALIGPKLVNPDGSIQYSCRRFMGPLMVLYRRSNLGKISFIRKQIDYFLMKDIDHNQTQEVDWIFGAAMFVRASAIKKIGKLDERFFMYFEDMDWCRRFKQAGFRVYYFPKTSMRHNHMRMSAQAGMFRSILTNKLTRIHIASAIKYFLKWGM